MIYQEHLERIKNLLACGVSPIAIAYMFRTTVDDVEAISRGESIPPPAPSTMRATGCGRNGQAPSAEEVDQWRQMVQRGAPLREVALRFKRSASTVKSYLGTDALLAPENRSPVSWRVTPDERMEWARRFEQGMTAHEIAMASGRADETVRIHLRRMGYKIPRKGKRRGYRYPHRLSGQPPASQRSIQHMAGQSTLI